MTKKDFFLKTIQSEEGRIGYIIAWLLGVPSSLLLLIFLIRGH
jgi:hypothetical protein